MRQRGELMRVIYLDARRCLSCHSCEIACAVSHSETRDLVSAVVSGARAKPRIYVEPVDDRKGLALTCHHCERAPCMMACPTEALRREASGAIVVEEGRCIGCHTCEMVCPFGVISVFQGVAVKCDLCHGEPACVAACPTGALSFQELSSFTQTKRRWAAKDLWVGEKF